MESRAARDADNRQAMEAIAASLAGLDRKSTASLTGPSASPYGADVDALARKAASWAGLVEVARVEARIAAVKARLVAGYPHRPSGAPFLSEAPGML